MNCDDSTTVITLSDEQKITRGTFPCLAPGPIRLDGQMFYSICRAMDQKTAVDQINSMLDENDSTVRALLATERHAERKRLIGVVEKIEEDPIGKQLWARGWHECRESILTALRAEAGKE